MAFINKPNYSLFCNRRDHIINFLKKDNPDLKNGAVVLFADFENDRVVFRQESSFYYLTGILEPGAILIMYLDGRQVLYLPDYGGIRERWTNVSVPISDFDLLAKKIGVTQVKKLGQQINSYSFSSIFLKENYDNFLRDVEIFIQNSDKQDNRVELFTLLDNFSSRYATQINLFRILLEFFPQIGSKVRDLAPLVHYLRRFKSEYEIDLIYKAAQVTCMAHDAAAKVISPGRIEYEIQAIIESVFIQAGALRPAFPSIIATGKNSTILHYTNRDHELKPGELVVVDIGAEYGFYSADLTRTYPVSGKFTDRQLEVYNIVLETLNYLESIAVPGMFLKNNDQPTKSLQHLAFNFFQKKGYSEYIAHGIGHFLGLDVHDVGDNIYPLAAGDVFTLEPGLYISEENMGIRIEDNYLMTDEGIVCLSFQLPRNPEQIEELMKIEEGF